MMCFMMKVAPAVKGGDGKERERKGGKRRKGREKEGKNTLGFPQCDGEKEREGRKERGRGEEEGKREGRKNSR